VLDDFVEFVGGGRIGISEDEPIDDGLPGHHRCSLKTFGEQFEQVYFPFVRFVSSRRPTMFCMNCV
jgi:hypothetical protein